MSQNTLIEVEQNKVEKKSTKRIKTIRPVHSGVQFEIPFFVVPVRIVKDEVVA